MRVSRSPNQSSSSTFVARFLHVVKAQHRSQSRSAGRSERRGRASGKSTRRGTGSQQLLVSTEIFDPPLHARGSDLFWGERSRCEAGGLTYPVPATST